ncbi:addiction module protein [Akkermansiaceae bacterium]|nr:addiction module protein [Akkermansiaceae bacterium]MDB4544907.1 addiction module protein [Akkermansiaceae bacterium]
MQNSLEILEEKALELPEEQRIKLAHKMIQSTEPPEDSETMEWWEAEIARRIEMVDSGDTETHKASEVFRTLGERIER